MSFESELSCLRKFVILPRPFSRRNGAYDCETPCFYFSPRSTSRATRRLTGRVITVQIERQILRWY